MQTIDKERAEEQRRSATQRAYRNGHTGERFVVKAVEPGRKYHVRKGESTRTTVWADSCDNAMTTYLRNQ